MVGNAAEIEEVHDGLGVDFALYPGCEEGLQGGGEFDTAAGVAVEEGFNAEAIAGELAKLPEVSAAEIAGPGFINLRLTPDVWLGELRNIAALGSDYGRSAVGAGTTVNVEYVSANPTGPMHMGH